MTQMQANQSVAALSTSLDTTSFLDKLGEAGGGEVVSKLPDQHKEALAKLLSGLVGSARAVDRNYMRAINNLIADIDQVLTEQINLIIHHPDFQKLEGSWRGLKRMVETVETGPNLKIQYFNCKKDELEDHFDEFSGSEWDKSPLFKKFYTDGFGILGGKPVGVIIGDFEFDHTSANMKILEGMAQIASAAHAPFIAAANSSLLGLKSWGDLPRLHNPSAVFDQAQYVKWNAFRNGPNAMYVGLTMPRYMSRQPYGPEKENPGKFDFVEDTAGQDSSKYTWSNAAYAMGARILESYDLYGWSTQICGVESGGLVTDLPTDTFETDGGATAMKISTEVAIPDRDERNLSIGDDKNLGGCGLIPLVHRKHENCAAFMSAQSAYNPKVDKKNPEATFNERLSAKLPNIFACSRFAHYLKAIVRDKVGGTALGSRERLEKFLQEWINRYVCHNPEMATEKQMAESPLRHAEVVVEDDPGNPGFYKAHFRLTPLYKLEGVSVSLSLVKMRPGS